MCERGHRPERKLDMRQNLERLVSCHQLISYPSEYARFNRAYEGALTCLNSGGLVKELYIVQYRASRGNCGGELYFSFVSSSLISSNGPYFLTDIGRMTETLEAALCV